MPLARRRPLLLTVGSAAGALLLSACGTPSRPDVADDAPVDVAADASSDVPGDATDDSVVDAGPPAPNSTEGLIREACTGRPAQQTPVTLRSAMGDPVGRLQNMRPGDLEGLLLLPAEPLRISSLRVNVRGGAGGRLRVRVVADYGRSIPDAMLDLLPPREIDWTQDGFVTLALDPPLPIHPAYRAWVLAEHVTEPMGLALGASTAPQRRSMVKSAAIIERLRAMGERFFEWVPPAMSNDYLVEAVGATVCAPLDHTWFANRTMAAGLTTAATTGRASWADVDGDGWDDLIGIGNVPMVREGPSVFRNRHDGTFENDSARNGLDAARGGLSTFADFDGDGDVDLYVGDYQDGVGPFDPMRGSRVFLQGSDGRFTRLDGVLEPAGPTAAATAGDCDGDGVLDLFIGQWLRQYPMNAAPDFVFRGQGDGTFADISRASGLPAALDGRPTYGTTFGDYDNDGDLDIFVANYGGRENDLWQNDGRCRLRNVARTTTIAMDDNGVPGTSFGIELGDYDNDGDLDVFETNIGHPRYDDIGTDHSRLLRNAGAPTWVFEDVTRDSGIRHVEGDIHSSWGDYDNDGDLDLYVSSTYPLQYSRLYRQQPDHTFVDVTYLAGVALESVGDGAWADYDRDGDLDFLTASGGRQVLFRNELSNGNHWIQIRLRAPAPNVLAVGARITLESTDGTRRMRDVHVGRSHHGAQNPLLQHVGLGAGAQPVTVRVRWADGMSTEYRDVAPDRIYVIERGMTPRVAM